MWVRENFSSLERVGKDMLKIKGVLSFFLAMLFSFSLLQISAFVAGEGIKVVIDGVEQVYDQSPVLMNDRTMVPLRGIFEKLGAEVSWEEATQTVSASKNGLFVSLQIGSNLAIVNGMQNILDQSAVLVNSRTLVPIRFVSEVFGAIVSWDNATQTVSITSAGSEGLVTVYPEESSEVLKNPYRGFLNYTAGMFNSGALSSDSVVAHMGVGYKRMGWSELEPVEGQFDWNVIDDNIEALKKVNMQFAFGIHAAMINNEKSFKQSTPLWVFEAGAKYTEEIGGQVKIPVWDDSIFMAKFQNLINAIKERYNDNINIAYVDIRNYGNWGEWHLYKIEQSKPLTLEAKKAHIDMWNGSKFQLMMFTNDLQATKYAQDSLNAGIRVDGCLDPTSLNEHKLLLKAYDKAGAVSESVAPGYWGYKPGEKWADKMPFFPLMFEKTLKEGKPSYMDIGGWKSQEFYGEQEDLVKRWSNRVGYWFKITKLQYPSAITKGTLTMQIKNDGVAPLYAGLEKSAVVKLALMDANNKILKVKTLDGIDPFDWKPGEYINETASYDFEGISGATKICLGVFTRESFETPDIKLGNNGEVIDGWYVLNSISSVEGSNVAANKLYSASDEYAEYGYGFREARYAFDGNDNTIWRTKDAVNAYLEVDFGEAKTVSNVFIKEAIKSVTGFKIQALNGDEWADVITGSDIGTEGKTISFTKTSTQKIRLSISGASDMVSICDFKVMK